MTLFVFNSNSLGGGEEENENKILFFSLTSFVFSSSTFLGGLFHPRRLEFFIFSVGLLSFY